MLTKIEYDHYFMPINKRQWLEVRLYKNIRHFRAEDARAKKNDIACYTYYPDQKRKKGLFGVVKFAKGHTDIGTVAHEFTHFIIDYQKTMDIKSDERLCRLMDNCVRTFHYMKNKLWFYTLLRITKVKVEK